MSYGQNPYGQNPYGGQPQQNPYGQRPPSGPPQQNPYGQPQPNPYGQPAQGRPQGPPSPYGQPQQNPYAPPGQGGHSPYGRPPGEPPQNPYAQPARQNPYAQPAQGQGGQRPYAQHPDAAEAWRQNQPPPAAPEGTAPSGPLAIAEHAVPVHTLPDDPESFVTSSLGEVIGVALRPRGNDLAALTRARQEAVSRMADMARAADADAVIGLRFDSNADEIVAYGTAVLLSDDLDYAVMDDLVDDDTDDSAEVQESFHALESALSLGEATPADESFDRDEPDAERTHIGTATASSSGASESGTSESGASASVASDSGASESGTSDSGASDFEQGDSGYSQFDQSQSGPSRPGPSQSGQGQVGPGQGWPFSN